MASRLLIRQRIRCFECLSTAIGTVFERLGVFLQTLNFAYNRVDAAIAMLDATSPSIEAVERARTRSVPPPSTTATAATQARSRRQARASSDGTIHDGDRSRVAAIVTHGSFRRDS